MTLNFGHKVFIGFLVFAGMMSFLVYQCMQTRYDLVSKDYYKDELKYQQVIDGKARAAQLSSAVTVGGDAHELVLQFPAEMRDVVVNVWFYCADNAGKDKRSSVQLDEHAKCSFDRHVLSRGNYTIKVQWLYNGQQYYTELPCGIR